MNATDDRLDGPAPCAVLVTMLHVSAWETAPTARSAWEVEITYDAEEQT